MSFSQRGLCFATISKAAESALVALHQWCDRCSIPLYVFHPSSFHENENQNASSENIKSLSAEMIKTIRGKDDDILFLFKTPHVLIHAQRKTDFLEKLEKMEQQRINENILCLTQGVSFGTFKAFRQDKGNVQSFTPSPSVLLEYQPDFLMSPTNAQSSNWLSMAKMVQKYYFWRFVDTLSGNIHSSSSHLLVTYFGAPTETIINKNPNSLDAEYDTTTIWLYTLFVLSLFFFLTTIAFVACFVIYFLRSKKKPNQV